MNDHNRLSPDPLSIRVMGIDFQNPIGLAAGFDKNGKDIFARKAQGFGFVEIGSITLNQQDGNDPPIFKPQPEKQAIINSCGCKNDGAKIIKERLTKMKFSIPVGINLTKSREVGNEDAASDLQKCLEEVKDIGDYFVINISCPNVSDIPDLQKQGYVSQILNSMIAVNSQKPILIKVSPDLSDSEIEAIVEIAIEFSENGVEGIVATNTMRKDEGGLSGRPLRKRSTEVVRLIRRKAAERLTIIGVGGIEDAGSAWEKITAGASLLQLYTAFHFGGVSVLDEIFDGLAERLDKFGFRSIKEAVGIEVNESS